MKTDAPEFREIAHGSGEYVEALVLRDAILRAPLGLSYAAEEIAGECGYRHVAGFLGGRIVVYGQLRESAEAGWLQMKQVAVEAGQQRAGSGRALVGYLEMLALGEGARGIVLHARETAAVFYDRLGYTREGERFTEVGLPHWRMRKILGAPESA